MIDIREELFELEYERLVEFVDLHWAGRAKLVVEETDITRNGRFWSFEVRLSP